MTRKGNYARSPEYRRKMSDSIKKANQLRAVPPIIRFMRLTDVRDPDECWEWKGNRDKDGYARFHHEGKTVRGARWLYGRLHDPLMPGMVPDHTCSNPSCVNPAHLVAKTVRENTLCGRGMSAQNARKTHCAQGHEFTPENTFLYRGTRRCRTCKRAYELVRYHRLKGAAA